MITLEQFLTNENFDEVFSLVDRFFCYINFNKPKDDRIIVTDKHKALIIMAMIKSNLNTNYLKDNSEVLRCN